MIEARVCPGCGSELTAGPPGAPCPRCVGGPHAASTVAHRDPAEPLSPAELAPHFPQLEILGLVGRGGMGAVYRARQVKLDRVVALKVLPADADRDGRFAERFTREARALARLNHPNIVTVYDFGEAGGHYYVLMEYVDGPNLRQDLEAGLPTPREALAIAGQVCAALEFAHDEGVIHRDVKPENILIDPRGRIKLADFGLAKLLGPDSGAGALTHTRQVMGTPHYMAPEQIESPREVDHRADVYAVGVVLYELLTGRLPLGRFDPPSHQPGVDPRLDDVIYRALEREPNRRYPTIAALRVDLVAENAKEPQGEPPAGASGPGVAAPAASWRALRRRALDLFREAPAWAALICMLGIVAEEFLPYVHVYDGGWEWWATGHSAHFQVIQAIFAAALLGTIATGGMRGPSFIRAAVFEVAGLVLIAHYVSAGRGFARGHDALPNVGRGILLALVLGVALLVLGSLELRTRLGKGRTGDPGRP